MKRNLYIIMALLALFACQGRDLEPKEQVVPAFAKGADISWASEMEADGVVFRNAKGEEAPLLEALGECGVNAIRLRVWVNPYGGWSSPADVLAVAQKVQKAGMALMVDFHYSDFFADPSRQTIPDAWQADKSDLNKLCQRVASHTTDVLQALKEAGVDVAWIQIGNETRNGMLWPAGQLWTEGGDIPDGRAHFAKLYNAGYAAAKAIFPAALVMPHLNHAYEDNEWWFRQLQAAGGSFDAIALSHYPQADNLDQWGNQLMTPAQCNQQAVANIQALIQTFGVPVIVSEVGVKPASADAAAILTSFVQTVKALDGCKGVFYWEPQVYGGWTPAVYQDPDAIYRFTGVRETWGAYNQGAFTQEGAPSAILSW